MNPNWPKSILRLFSKDEIFKYRRADLKEKVRKAIAPDTSLKISAFAEFTGDAQVDLLHIEANNITDDELYDIIEQSIFTVRALWISGLGVDANKNYAIASVTNKYKIAVRLCLHFARTGDYFVVPEQVQRQKAGLSHKDLAADYDSSYYLMDCGGFDTFNETAGKHLDSRLQGVLRLAGTGGFGKVLDIGCGRGELAYALYKRGAVVLGLDYSLDAISIACTTYKQYIGERLQFLKLNILDLPENEKFDAIVMSDVVEHIEGEALESIFAKISRLMSPNGRLVIHTAPNKLVYTIDYVKRHEAARQMGLFIPKNPRSYYEDIMHINEQTPESLENLLKMHFDGVLVWTGDIIPMERIDIDSDSPHDASIFALATNTPISFEWLRECLDNRLNRDSVSINIKSKDADIATRPGAIAGLTITLENNSNQTLEPSMPYPVNLSYHILDDAGNVVLFDGVRTPLPEPLAPGAKLNVNVRVAVPANLENGRKYILHLTLVQEQNFWFSDINEAFCATVELHVH